MKLKEFLYLFREYARSRKIQKSEIDFKLKDLTFLTPHIKRNLRRYIGLFILMIFSSLLSLPSPAITGYIVDKVFVKKDIAVLALLVGLLVALLLLAEVVLAIQEYFAMRLSQEFIFSIRILLIERILRYPLSFFKSFQTGYLVSRLEEANYLGSFFSRTVLSLAESTIRFLGVALLISRYNSRLTLVALIALPLFFEVARRSYGALRATGAGVMERSAKIRGSIQETLSGIEVVKAFTKERREIDKIRAGLRKIIEIEIFENLFSSFSGRLVGVITGLNLLLILWVGGHEIIAGRLTVGRYVAFVAYIGFLYSPIQRFAMIFLQFQRTFMACKRISSFLEKTAEDEQPERAHKFECLQGNICFKNVRYHYEDGKDVLHDISFSIKEGEKIAFVGKSGAGKSTLVHLILGFIEPTDGHIELDGVDIIRIKLESLRDHIGLVSQNIFLFEESILNNIKYSMPNASIEDVISAAKAAGCHSFISDFPAGYNTNVGEVGKRLSAGEKQRISIARCLLKNPDVVIFDEPTAHLDLIAAKKLIISIQDLFCNKTCIIISHHINNLHWADKIYVLDKGHIVQKGTHGDLIQEAGKYRELFKDELAAQDRAS